MENFVYILLLLEEVLNSNFVISKLKSPFEIFNESIFKNIVFFLWNPVLDFNILTQQNYPRYLLHYQMFIQIFWTILPTVYCRSLILMHKTLPKMVKKEESSREISVNINQTDKPKNLSLRCMAHLLGQLTCKNLRWNEAKTKSLKARRTQFCN